MQAQQRQIYNLDKYTKYIQVELEDLCAYQFLLKVKENRKTYWPTRDEHSCTEFHIQVLKLQRQKIQRTPNTRDNSMNDTDGLRAANSS